MREMLFILKEDPDIRNEMRQALANANGISAPPITELPTAAAVVEASELPLISETIIVEPVPTLATALLKQDDLLDVTTLEGPQSHETFEQYKDRVLQPAGWDANLWAEAIIRAKDLQQPLDDRLVEWATTLLADANSTTDQTQGDANTIAT
jgi:hypothetical protein